MLLALADEVIEHNVGCRGALGRDWQRTPMGSAAVCRLLAGSWDRLDVKNGDRFS